MKKFLIAVLLIITVLVSGFFIYQKRGINEEIKIDDNKLTQQKEELIVAGSFETKVLNIVDSYVKFDVKYPYFNGADNDFNLNIENFVKLQMEDHRIISKDNWTARFDTRVEGDTITKLPINEDDKFSFFSDFTIVQSNSNYISFILKYGGFNGGAHGYENLTSFNYDIKNKKNIQLKELFANNPEYLDKLSIESREYLKKEFATISEEDKKDSSPEALKEYVDNIISMIKIGTEPIDENFGIFTFTDNKIKIYFSQYQVGPYVIGMPEFEINRK